MGMTLKELELEGAPDVETLERRKAMYEELVRRGVWPGNACGPVYDDAFEAVARADLAAANAPPPKDLWVAMGHAFPVERA